MTEQFVMANLRGAAVTIRPMRGTDEALEARLVQHLSMASRRYRFFGGVRELSPAELKLLCNVDGRNSMAFVATVMEHGTETAIGVSRYAPSQKPEAREMALTVADDWQHQGVAELLMAELIKHARLQGVKELYTVELADNHAMRQLALSLGMSVQRDPEAAEQVVYTLRL